MFPTLVWWSGVVVNALASIDEVNLHRARLVLRWATVSGFSSRCRTFISVCYQPATQSQLSLPSLRGGKMSTSFGWEGKSRYGLFRWQMNVGCAGKTVRSPYFMSAFTIAAIRKTIRVCELRRSRLRPCLPYAIIV